jgi:hypothetical protein
MSYAPVHKSNYAWWPLENIEELRDPLRERSLTVTGPLSNERNPINYFKHSPIYKQQTLPRYSRDVYLANRGRR